MPPPPNLTFDDEGGVVSGSELDGGSPGPNNEVPCSPVTGDVDDIYGSSSLNTPQGPCLSPARDIPGTSSESPNHNGQDISLEATDIGPVF